MPPAASEPPTTSDAPASRAGSIPAARSSFTCAPGGSCWSEAPAVAARPKRGQRDRSKGRTAPHAQSHGSSWGEWDTSGRWTPHRHEDSQLRFVVEQRAQLVRLGHRALADEVLAHVRRRTAVDRARGRPAAARRRSRLPPASTTCGRNVSRTTRTSGARASSPTIATSRTSSARQEVDRLQQVRERRAGVARRSGAAARSCGARVLVARLAGQPREPQQPERGSPSCPTGSACPRGPCGGRSSARGRRRWRRSRRARRRRSARSSCRRARAPP